MIQVRGDTHVRTITGTVRPIKELGHLMLTKKNSIRFY